MKTLRILTTLALFASTLSVWPQEAENLFPALGAPANRKVDISWNRFHDTEGIGQVLQKIHDAYPDLTRLYSIGETYEGRPIRCLEITNFAKGDPARKPGMYIDGNIHGNEVQAAEVVMYTAWYLTENFGQVDKITELLDNIVFYLIPTINPDGRDYWFHAPNDTHSSRTGKVPLDNDRDGQYDEDPMDDLNGDGSISSMRIRDPNGRWKAHPDYPDYLMVSVEPDEKGEFTLLGDEGIDNDGDGDINEDGPGGYDSNRNWSFDWQPQYVQYGANEYPFSLPNTRAVADFVMNHPNIAAAQSYHNFGGMILRGPGRKDGEMQRRDNEILQQIGNKGEQMLPFYRSLIIFQDLYTTWGNEVDWFYGAQGILTFTNELWTLKNMYRSDQQDDKSQVDFIKYQLQEQGLVKWKEYDHPTYGKIEIGGFTKQVYRIPPSFLLEEECHRNMAFTLYHASQMPQISFGETKVEKLGEGLYKVWVEINNDGMIPSRSAQDVAHNINPSDSVTLEGEGLQVLSSGRVTDRYFKKVEAVKTRPQRVLLNSVPGMEAQRVQFIVSGSGKATVTFDSTKGGKISTEVELR